MHTRVSVVLEGFNDLEENGRNLDQLSVFIELKNNRWAIKSIGGLGTPGVHERVTRGPQQKGETFIFIHFLLFGKKCTLNYENQDLKSRI